MDNSTSTTNPNHTQNNHNLHNNGPRRNETGKTRSLIHAALGAALIAVCSFLTIPGAVPFTLQTFAVCMVLCLFGGKVGFSAIAVYIALGAVGAPVFSGFSGGFGVLLGTTGGYIVGFLLIGACYWTVEKLTRTPMTTVWQFAALIVGTLLCYACGTVWFAAVYSRANSAIGFTTALSWCVVPYLLPDAAKLTLAVLLGKKLRPYLNRRA